MSIENFAHFNDISHKLRTELEERVRGFGKIVRYKFNISNPNPDPSNYNGSIVYPTVYTLDPATFTIKDNYEDRHGKSKTKTIALVDDSTLNDKGVPTRFKRVRLFGRSSGILTLQIEDKIEDLHMAMFLELHPKLKNGLFGDKNSHQIISRIDEVVEAKSLRTERTARLKALNAAQAMNDSELVNFADAMQWDSTQEIEVLRNAVEELADRVPVYFNDLVESKEIEYQSLIKQAMDKQLITFIPSEYKFVWEGNQQTIVILQPTGNKNHIQKMSEWMQTNGTKGDEIYKKLKSLVKGGKKEKVAE